MNAQHVAEGSAVYALEDAVAPAADDAFELLTTAPQGVAKLRELILALALRGRLVNQDPADEPASQLLASSRRRWRQLMEAGTVKRERPAGPITSEEERFPLPAGWAWCRIVDTGQYINGLAFKPSDWGTVGRPIIRIQNLSGRNDDYHRTSKDIDPSVIVKQGDILVSWSATLDAFVWAGEEGVLNQHIFRVTPSPLLDRHFLFWLLKGSIQELAASDHAHGLVMSHINRGPFLAHAVAIPPLAEQRRIIARVEELMDLCDELEAHGRLQDEQHARLLATLFDALVASTSPAELADNWQRIASHFDLLLDRPEAVDALEQTVLQLAVRGLLVPQDPAGESASALLARIQSKKEQLAVSGQVKRSKYLPPVSDAEMAFKAPQGWAWARLNHISDNRLGKMLDKAKNTGTLRPYLRNTNVQWHRIELDDIKQMRFGDHEAAEYKLADGDLLVCEGGYPGRCAIWNAPGTEMFFQKALHRVRPLGGVMAEYVELCLRTDSDSGALSKYFTGATIKHFAGQELNRYAIPLPPVSEQHRIVTRVEELRGLCANLRQHLQQAQATQSDLADALVAATVQSDTAVPG